MREVRSDFEILQTAVDYLGKACAGHAVAHPGEARAGVGGPRPRRVRNAERHAVAG